MKKLLLLLFALSSFNSIFAQDAWRSLGPDDLNQASFNSVKGSKMISKNNNLWVLNDEFLSAQGGDYLKIHWYDGLKWHFIDTPFQVDYYNDVDLAVDNNNVPYLSCTVSITRNTPSDTGKLFIVKFDGTAWVTVGPDQFISQGNSYGGNGSKLAIDSNNKIYVIFYDSVSDASIVKTFNGTTWELVGGSPISSYTRTHLYTDKNNVVFMTYQTNNLLYVKKFDGANWVNVGVSGFPSYDDGVNCTNQIPLAFDGNNTPYIVYRDTTRNQKLSVKKFNGTNWVVVGSLGFTSDSISYPSISIGSNNIPYVGFENNTVGGINVEKFNGSSWELVGNSNFSQMNSYGTMVLDNNNTPFVSYVAGQTIVEKFNGVNWGRIVDTPVSQGVSDYSKIAIDANSIPYVAYKDVNNAGKIAVKRYVSGNWEVVGSLGFSEGEISDTFLKFDNNNIPYIAYVGMFNTGKITVKKFNGVSWEAVGSQFFSPDYVPEFYLNFDQNNTPYIMYKGGNSMADNSSCSVQRFNGSNWVLVGSPNFSGGEVYGLKICFDATNHPMVVYSNSSNYFVFKTFDGSNWVSSSPTVPIPEKGQIHFDNYSTPYLSYLGMNQNLTIKKKMNDGSWALLGQNGISSLGSYPGGSSMVFDSNNTAYIIYPKIVFDSYSSGKHIISVQKFNGTNWEVLGSEDISAGSVSQFSLAVKNNIPYVAYGSKLFDNGLFVKYFGAEGALSTSENTSLLNKKVIFPNPVKSSFSVSGNEVINEIEIYDLLGKSVLHQQNPKSEINIEFLPDGFYISKIKTEKGISTVKLIKE